MLRFYGISFFLLTQLVSGQLVAKESEKTVARLPSTLEKKSVMEKIQALENSYSNLAALYETVDEIRPDAERASEELKKNAESLLASLKSSGFSRQEGLRLEMALCAKERAETNFKLFVLKRGKWLKEFGSSDSKRARSDLKAEFEKKLLEVDKKEKVLRAKIEKVNISRPVAQAQREEVRDSPSNKRAIAPPSIFKGDGSEPIIKE